MSENSILSTSTIEPPQPEKTKFQRERRAFRRLLPQLLLTHRGKYVAIHEERMVDCGDSKLTVALRVFKAYGYVPIYVSLAVEEPRIERAPGFRELRGRANA